MFNLESIVFVVYLAFMLGIGVYFFVKSKDGGEKEYKYLSGYTTKLTQRARERKLDSFAGRDREL